MFMQLWHEGAVRREGGDGEYADAPTLNPWPASNANGRKRMLPSE
jgi:hypothetical protein